MIRETYMVELRAGLAASRVDALVSVLVDTAKFIRGVVYSNVHREETGGPFDLIWDFAYEDHAALRHYMVHPYHSNLLDEFLSPESLESVAERSMAVIWDTDRPFIVDGQPAFATGDGVLADYPTPEGGVVIVEHLELVDGSLPEYTRLLHEVYLPLAEPHGVALEAILQSVETPNQCVVLWSVPSWRAVAALRWELLTTDGLELWENAIRGLRTGKHRRNLVAVGGAGFTSEIRPGSTLLLEETTLPTQSFEQTLTTMNERMTRTPPLGARLVSWLRSPDQTGESDTTLVWELEEGPDASAENVLEAVHGDEVSATASVFRAMPVHAGTA
jgi:hypothetical protein